MTKEMKKAHLLLEAKEWAQEMKTDETLTVDELKDALLAIADSYMCEAIAIESGLA